MTARPGIALFRAKLLDLRIGPHRFFHHALLMQHFGGAFEPFVLQQPVDQLLARILFRDQLLQCRIARQQHFRLDLDQGRGHVDELGAQLDIHLRGASDVLEILRGNLRDGDVIDVDLLLADQVQQQVERPVVVFEMEIERNRHFVSG